MILSLFSYKMHRYSLGRKFSAGDTFVVSILKGINNAGVPFPEKIFQGSDSVYRFTVLAGLLSPYPVLKQECKYM